MKAGNSSRRKTRRNREGTKSPCTAHKVDLFIASSLTRPWQTNRLRTNESAMTYIRFLPTSANSSPNWPLWYCWCSTNLLRQSPLVLNILAIGASLSRP